MDRKKLILLLIALVVAVGTAMVARSMFTGAPAPVSEAAVPVAAAPEPEGPKVLVAKRALPMGTIITADAVGYQLWPQEMVQDAYFIEGEADMDKLLGTVVRRTLTAGEPVTQGSLVAPNDRGFLAAALGPGMRAVTVPVSAESGVGGFVFPGDHVDIMLTSSVTNDDGELKSTETVLRNLRVLATDQSTQTTTTPEGQTQVQGFRNVTLEVTPRIAEKIQVAQSIGTLSLSLRSLADSQSDLDRAIAASDVDLPANASPADEARALRHAVSRPQEGGSTFVTGGDVSRFQSSKMPRRPGQAADGAIVSVSRGSTVTAETVGRGRSVLSTTSQGVSSAGAAVASAVSAP